MDLARSPADRAELCQVFIGTVLDENHSHFVF